MIVLLFLVYTWLLVGLSIGLSEAMGKDFRRRWLDVKNPEILEVTENHGQIVLGYWVGHVIGCALLGFIMLAPRTIQDKERVYTAYSMDEARDRRDYIRSLRVSEDKDE